MAQNKLPTSSEITQLIKTNELEAADKKLDIILVAKPQSSLAFFYKAVVLFKKNEVKESEFYLKLLEKQDPQLRFAKNKEAYLFFRKDVYEVLARPESWDLYKDKNYTTVMVPKY